MGSGKSALSLEFGGNESLSWVLDGNSLSIDASLAKCSGEEVLQLPGHPTIALYARDSLTIQDAAVVDATPTGVAIMSGGAVEVGSRASVPTVWARGNATVRSFGSVIGSLIAGGSLSLQAGASISGAQLPASYVAEHPLAFSVAFPSSNAGNVTLDAGRSVTLAPGAYGNVTLRGTLTLSSGTYYFDSLMADNGAALNFVSGGATPVVIYVKRDLTWRGSTSLGGPPLFLAHFGTSDAFVESPLRGNILAPQAKLVLGNQSGSHVGRFFAKAIELRSGARVRFAQ